MHRRLAYQCRGRVSFCRSAIVALAATLALLVMIWPASVCAQTELSTIRSDVRTSPPTPPETAPAPSREHDNDSVCPHGQRDGEDPCDAFNQGLFSAGFAVGWLGFTSPYWAPRALLDDGNCEVHFPRFPYDDCGGYLVSSSWVDASMPTQPLSDSTQSSPVSESLMLPTRQWGGQMRADYGDQFADITMINSQLILETTSRVGVDTSIQYLRERLPDGGFDGLTLGDCNLVYRVAQHPRAQVRMGIGANWLTDAAQTDLGFNFTYGGDFFPRKPWVVSTAIDWGTLGHAGLFRFRTTAGIIINCVETYAGYEYLDIGTTQSNALIAGVRIWF